jgi:hypothetical protein
MHALEMFGTEDAPRQFDCDLSPDGFRWCTSEGQILTLQEMDTKHIFNCMKMCFNHLATLHGGEPVWFTRVYLDYLQHAALSSGQLVGLVVFFAEEIERRGDLPSKYWAPFTEIMRQVRPAKLERKPEVQTWSWNR